MIFQNKSQSSVYMMVCAGLPQQSTMMFEISYLVHLWALKLPAVITVTSSIEQCTNS